MDHSSVQFSHSVVSDYLPPHEPQHARPPCPSPTPGVHPNSCSLSWLCQPTISSSVIPFSSWPQSFPASRSFQMSQLFASGGQSIGVSASTSVLPMNIQDWSPLGWTGWISLQCRATQDRWVMVESSDKMWSTGERNGKPFQHSCLENPVNSMKRQKDMTLKDELPRSVGAQYATGEEWRNNSRENEEMEPKQKQRPVVDVTGDGSKSPML